MNKRDIVNLIKRGDRVPDPPGVDMSAPVAPPKGAVPVAPVTPSTPAAVGGGSRSLKDPQIEKMQTALQNLAVTISHTVDYDAMVNAMQNPGAPGENQDQFKAQFGKDMFSNFMVNRYLRNSPVKGVEYDSDPNKVSMQQKNPSDLKSMYNILNTMKRIGNPRFGEIFADGIWGPRTNNSLLNAAAITDAVAKLGKDLGMHTTIDLNKVEELKTLIPASDADIDQEEKAKRAPQISAILTAARELFLEFRDQVLRHPAYANLIEGHAPIATIEPDMGHANGEEQPIFNDIKQKGTNSTYVSQPGSSFTVTLMPQFIPTQFQNAPMNSLQLTAADLLNMDTFTAWAKNNAVLANIMEHNPQTWPRVATTFLDQIKSEIAQKMGTAPTQAPQHKHHGRGQPA